MMLRITKSYPNKCTSDGLLFVGDRYKTGGQVDSLQSQGSLTLSQDHSLLLAANTGSGTISVFRVHKSTLTLLNQANSGGSEPLSIAVHSPYVYVLNSAAAGSVAVFRWDDKQLSQIPDSTLYLSATSADGSSITVRPDGKALVVTERLTNNIDTFAIESDGTLAQPVVNQSQAPGVFSASFAPDGVLLVSELSPANASNAAAISSYNIGANGALTPVSQSLPTLGRANCWNAATPNGLFVYTSNAGSENVSGFSIAGNGSLMPILSTVMGINPMRSANLDIAVSADSQYLYTLNSGGGAVGMFAVGADGKLTNLETADGLAKGAGLNGIAAY